ncbi:MAG TPA: M64 family metallopeptidase [Bdellovibrionales bacterium]|nr:M64 family metallopeptidase [Bdellovibrionales bacterium]
MNSSGEFIESSFIKDPMRNSYQVSAWAASKKSQVTTLKSVTSVNRINLVFVGDGYTASQIPVYVSDVDRSIASILKQEPFKSYASYFAFHRVDVVSSESGVSRANGGKIKTALEMTFGCSGLPRLLCANLNKVSAEAGNAPAVDVVFALANSDEYGGAGYLKPAVATYAARNPSSLELALHEFGHSFAGLGDEYDTQGVVSNCTSFANVAKETRAQMQSAKAKWYRWLDVQNVSAFPGSCYSSKYYRPTFASKMRVLGNAYEEVNIEKFILKIYEKVKPIESFMPVGRYAAGVFWISPMKPAGRPLDITWTLNGKPLDQFKGQSQIDVRTLLLTSNSNKLAVTVIDNTSAVRDEAARKKLMTQTVTWTVTR